MTIAAWIIGGLVVSAIVSVIAGKCMAYGMGTDLE